MGTFTVATAPTDVDDADDANEPAANASRNRRPTRLECVESVNLEYTTWWQWLLWRRQRHQRPAAVQCSVVDSSGGTAGKINSYVAVNVNDETVVTDTPVVTDVDASVEGVRWCYSSSWRSREKWLILLLALVAVASVAFLAISLFAVLRTPRNTLLLIIVNPSLTYSSMANAS